MTQKLSLGAFRSLGKMRRTAYVLIDDLSRYTIVCPPSEFQWSALKGDDEFLAALLTVEKLGGRSVALSFALAKIRGVDL